VNTGYTYINIRKLLVKGQAKLDTKHAEKERRLRGVYRAGSAGCIGDDGEVYGECHRVAHARALGHDKPVSDDRKIMFAGGETNEDTWERLLKGAWPEKNVIRGLEISRDEEWGKIVGSPDIVLASDDNGPEVVLELKQVSALNSACQRELEGNPDPKHLVQAATYMWLMQLPGVLCYTNRSDHAVQFMAKKYGTKKVLPFYRMFYLTIRDGRLYYRDEHKAEEVKTLVTVEGIQLYYKMLSRVVDEGLGPRPSSKHVNGAPAGYDRCAYCDFQETCDQYEHRYDAWVDAVSLLCKDAM
jgi:hypothetical protein